MNSQKPDRVTHHQSGADRPPARQALSLRRRWLLIAAVVTGGGGVAAWALARERMANVYRYEVINEYPHDAQAYCQGLVFEDGFLYEGTGNYGESTLRKVDLESGGVLQQIALNKRLFGEGITIWNDQIFQLTWKSRFGIVYDKETFAAIRRFPVAGEGWGLTHNGQHLIISDGSSTLRFVDPETYRVVRRVAVRSRGRPVKDLNELEFVDGEILANIWMRDAIARIEPQSGNIVAWIDLSGLKPAAVRRDREAVLNGIAYDDANKRLFVTGKNWPKLFEIRVKK